MAKDAGEDGWGRLIPGDFFWRQLREPRVKVHGMHPIVEIQPRSDFETAQLAPPLIWSGSISSPPA